MGTSEAVETSANGCAPGAPRRRVIVVNFCVALEDTASPLVLDLF